MWFEDTIYQQLANAYERQKKWKPHNKSSPIEEAEEDRPGCSALVEEEMKRTTTEEDNIMITTFCSVRPSPTRPLPRQRVVKVLLMFVFIYPLESRVFM